MNKEFQKHKKIDTVKWIAVLLAVCILGVSVAAALTKGFTDGNPFGWLDDNKEPVKTEEPAKPASVVSSIFNSPFMSLEASAASATSDNVNLTATIYPANATNKAVDWSIIWANPKSAFATGKNASDYVSVIPTSDGALTAAVSCKQAFGEPIVATVTSRDNTEATAINAR